MLVSTGEKLRVLLVKPYQPTNMRIASPPLGLLYLASTLRQTFGDNVEIRLIDLTVDQLRYFDARELMKEFRPHVVGLSALNWEAEESGRFALMTQNEFPGTVVALGGPFAHRNTQKICATGVFDWIFDGEADWSFPLACRRWFFEDQTMDDIIGLTWRAAPDEAYTNNAEVLSLGGKRPAGVVEDVDAIPLPAWDLIDFEKYAKVRNFMSLLKGKRYATIFTSRGCPYLCTYCHDIFGKRFRFRSPENVAAEVKMLKSMGVDELQIVDDIFNMNPPRMKAVCRAIEPYKMHITFPNGLRFDILDEEGCEALTRAGTYAACVAIETVTPRLQELIKKHLRAEKARQGIHWMSQRGVLVRGFFMLGFPTETLEEINATIDYAVNGEITQAYFFNVVPQPGTPLYDLALQEDSAALEAQTLTEYGNKRSWYNQAYGVDMEKVRKNAYIRFFILSPRRCLRLLRLMPWKNIVMEFRDFVRFFFWRKRREFEALPEDLMPLSRLYAADEKGMNSADTQRKQSQPRFVAAN